MDEMINKYPKECRDCGCEILNEDDNWNGMCKDCFDDRLQDRMD